MGPEAGTGNRSHSEKPVPVIGPKREEPATNEVARDRWDRWDRFWYGGGSEREKDKKKSREAVAFAGWPEERSGPDGVESFSAVRVRPAALSPVSCVPLAGESSRPLR
jgi:hypothetical protein